MKAFLVGLIFLVLTFILAGLGILLFPLILVLGMALRVVIMLVFVIFAIWLLGKMIILIWESLKPKDKA